MPEFRHIGWAEYGDLTETLAKKVRAASVKFDLVVGIARGGIPVAMVVSDQLAVPIDFINVKSYTGIAERATPKVLSTLSERISGKSLLLVDDLVDQGDTLSFVKSYLESQNPSAVKTAVLFKKPWSKAEPDFYLEVVDKWIVFPFESGEVERLRAD